MKHKFMVLLSTLLVVCCIIGSVLVSSKESEDSNQLFTWTDDFSGTTSSRYTPYGRWWNNTVSDSSVNYGGTLGNEGGSGDGFCYYYLNDFIFSDFTMEFDIVSEANPATCQYGVVFRADNPSPNADDADGYTVMYDGNWIFAGRLDVSFTQIKTGNYAYNPKDNGIVVNHWKLVCQGSNISLFLNGAETPAISITDETYTEGQIGFRAFAPANVKKNIILDNLKVTGVLCEKEIKEDYIFEDAEWEDDFSKDTGALYTPYGMWWNNAVSERAVDYRGKLGNEGGEKSGYTYYYLNDYKWADFTMEFDVDSVLRPLSTTYGIMLRAANPSPDTDSGDGYTIMFDGNWVFCAKLDGSFKQINSGLSAYCPKDHGITIKHWKIVCTGNNIKVFFNGSDTAAIDFIDKTYRYGQIGFRTLAPSKKTGIVVLDNLSVKGTVCVPKAEEEKEKIETEDFLWHDDFNKKSGDYYLVYGRWWENCTSADSGERYDNVLANEGGDVDGYCFYYLKKYKWVDFTMEFDVVSTASDNTTYGVMLRASNPSPEPDSGDGYTIMYDGNWVFCAKLNGEFKQITSGLYAYNPKENGITIKHWKIACSGTNIKVYFNGSDTPAVDFNDETYASGFVGFRDFAPKNQLSTVVLDNLSVSGTIQKSAASTTAFSNRGKGNVYDYSLLTANEKTDYSDSNSLKVIAIGNSYTEDGTAYLNQIARDYGYKDVTVGNMYIGGCDIETHWNNVKGNKADYQYQKITDTDWIKKNKTTLKTALQDEKWDVVILNQQSMKACDADSYENLINLVAFVKGTVKNPDVKIGFQMTWGYDASNPNEKFVSEFNSDSYKMYSAIVSAVRNTVGKNPYFDFIIPVGTTLENLRNTDFKKAIVRDTASHLSFGCGRYAAGLTWFAAITGCNIDELTWIPEKTEIEASDLDIIKKAVNNSISTPYEVKK